MLHFRQGEIMPMLRGPGPRKGYQVYNHRSQTSCMRVRSKYASEIPIYLIIYIENTKLNYTCMMYLTNTDHIYIM
jgi:hypothetical protein